MSDEFVWEWVGWMEQVVLVLIPAMAFLTIGAVVLSRKYWPYKLPTILAIKAAIVGGCVTWLVIPVIWRRLFGETPVVFYAITATVIVLLCSVPFISVGYLIWLDRRRGKRNDRRQH